MTNNFRALCAELLRGLDENRHPEVRYPGHLRLVMASARAELADGPAAPAPPADGEVAELVRTLTGIAHWRRRGRPGEGDPSPFDIRQADRLDRAAELLLRLIAEAPVLESANDH